VAAETEQLARKMPGFVSIKTFEAEDGECVSIVEFASEEAHKAWRDHPLHRIAQERGRAEFYSEYHIQVCSRVRQYGFSAPRI
jgi:heme-degrading monooxygenase HmoA